MTEVSLDQEDLIDIPEFLLADDHIDGRTFIVRLIPLGLVEILDLDATVELEHWSDDDSIFVPLLGEFGPVDIEKVVKFHREQLVATMLVDEQLMPLPEIGDLMGLNPDSLRQSILRGKIRGKKIGRDWHTCGQWIAEDLGWKLG